MSNRRTRILAVAALALLAPAVNLAAAEPDLVTDRPDQTESALVVPVGRVQIESGVSHVEDDAGSVELEIDSWLSTLVRIGLTERAELRAGWAGYLSADPGGADGAGDASLGVKIALFEERGRRPQTALVAATTLPIGDDAFSSERADPSVLASFANTLTERVGLGTNVGVAWSSGLDATGERDTLADLLWSASLGVAAWERGGWFVEAFGRTGLNSDVGARNAVDAGVTWRVRPNLQLDVSGGVGVSDAAPDWFLGAGVSVRLPR